VPRDESTLSPDPEERLLRAGFSRDGDDDAFIVQSLRERRARQRVLALRAGNRRGLLDDEDWERALGDPDVDVRREALSLLAYVDDVDGELLGLVRGLLEDGDALVVDAAIFTLGEHLDADAVTRLAEIALEHEDARCRESAVDDKPPVRRRAIVALSNFEGPDVDAALTLAAQDRDWQVRAAVDQLNKDLD